MGYVQMAEIVPNLKFLEQKSAVFSSKGQAEPSEVSQPNGLKLPWKGVDLPDLYISAVGTGFPTPGHDILKKVDLLGCAEWDPMDQEARNIVREYLDVFARDDLDLRQTSVVKHKIFLKG